MRQRGLLYSSLFKRYFAQAYIEQPEAQIIAGATDIGLWITKQNRKLPAFISVQDVDGLDDVQSKRTAL